MDFVLVLGDFTSHNDWDYDNETKLANNNHVLATIKKTFWGDSDQSRKEGSKPIILPINGNHEGGPENYENYDDPNDFLNSKIMQTYAEFIGQDRVDDLVNKGFYSYNTGKFRLVGIDGALNYSFNSYLAKDGFDPKNILQNLAKELHDAELNQQQVILFSHVPLSDVTSQSVLTRFLQVLYKRFSRTIAAAFSAHTHRDHVSFFQDSKGESQFIDFTSPSMTTYNHKNPSFRVYDLSQNGRILDYTQYRFNIEVYNVYAQQNNFDIKYEVSYRFREEYDLQDIKDLGNPRQIFSYMTQMMPNLD